MSVNCKSKQTSYVHTTFICIFLWYIYRQNIHECRLLGMAQKSLLELARTKQQSRWMPTKNTKGLNNITSDKILV